MMNGICLFVASVFSSVAFAQEGAGAPAAAPMAGPPVNPVMQFVPILLMFGVIYFLMIRPQQKRQKEHQAMLSAIKDGDDVILASGIIGKVAGLAEKVVTVEIAPNTKVKVLRSQISQVVKGSLKDLVG